MTDKKELQEALKKLLVKRAAAPEPEDNQWTELGKHFAETIQETMDSPRLTGMECLLLRMSLNRNDAGTLALLNRRYMERCNWYAEKYGSGKMWDEVDPAYDKPEYRAKLQELGREVNVQNLFILMDERNAQLVP